MSDVKLEDIVSLAKRRGFIFQGSDVYGGLSGTWDYGPLGVALKKNIMALWWKTFVEERDDMLGVDAAILMNQKVWQASGHVDTFADPLVECMNCNPVTRHRVDKIIDNKDYQYFLEKLGAMLDEIQEKLKQKGETLVDVWGYINKNIGAERYDALLNTLQADSNKFKNDVDTFNDIQNQLELAKRYVGPIAHQYLKDFVACPVCKAHSQWTQPGYFNMMFETNVGLSFSNNIENINVQDGLAQKALPSFGQYFRQRTYDTDSITYLRPETAQGIFTNFRNVVDTFYPDVPFGIAQAGKAFRNEISPRDFVFRSREFEQMEIEYFVNPSNWGAEFEKWIVSVEDFLEKLGLPKGKIHKFEVPEADRAHYSNRTIDFEYDFPIGREELLGLAYRTDFDLMNIQKASGKSMEYRPKDGSKPFVPHVIEPSFGVERALMAVLSSAYTEDEINGEKRTVLKLPKHLAPVKVAVSPLLKNKPELVEKAREVYAMLKKEFGAVMWDDNGNIGKRYRRQDEIGTPYCVVIDFDTLEGATKDTVTIRNRDTTEQERIKIEDLGQKLQ